MQVRGQMRISQVCRLCRDHPVSCSMRGNFRLPCSLHLREHFEVNASGQSLLVKPPEVEWGLYELPSSRVKCHPLWIASPERG
jgi:hypothetical protein